MNIEEKIKWLENELKEIKKEVEKQEINGNVRKPKKGEVYYFLTDYGWRDRDFWEESCEALGRLKIGNYFKTEGESEFMVERLKVIQELKQFSRPFVNNGHNWYFFFNNNKKKIFCDWVEYIQDSVLYFESEEVIQRAIETIGEERIKKYYLQVEE